MKEATGELNMTVITVVAIAAIAALFYAFIWPSLKTTIAAQSVCANGPNTTVGTSGQAGYVSCGAAAATGTYTCNYTADDGNGGVKAASSVCKTK